MPKKINSPTTIKSAGNKPKTIHEYIGSVNTKTTNLSIAHMKSPSGWSEPGQRPDFDEYTIVLDGIWPANRGRYMLAGRQARLGKMQKRRQNRAAL